MMKHITGTKVEESEKITAESYRLIVEILFGRSTKLAACEKFRISRPTHNHWLRHGITRTKQARRIRAIIETEITSLRARARSLDRWTTLDRVEKPILRLTHQPIPKSRAAA